MKWMAEEDENKTGKKIKESNFIQNLKMMLTADFLQESIYEAIHLFSEAN
jgi:hypothetical protein